MVFSRATKPATSFIAAALGRRNLSEDQKSYLRGKRYQSEKKKVGAQPDNQNKNKGTAVVPLKTSESLATEYNVHPNTIKNDAKYADAVDTIAKSAGKQYKDAILSGELGAI